MNSNDSMISLQMSIGGEMVTLYYEVAPNCETFPFVLYDTEKKFLTNIYSESTMMIMKNRKNTFNSIEAFYNFIGEDCEKVFDNIRKEISINECFNCIGHKIVQMKL